MNLRGDADRLDSQLESLMAGLDGKPDSEWNALLAVAAKLRNLPDPSFKNRLRADLFGAS
jgi:hypothetical protein